jgi:VWFA-related protein
MKQAAAVLVALTAAAVAIAQQQPYFETFEVRLHNLDVVVTDAKGKPVQGLTKDDFLVFEDGVQQNITNFSVYDDGTWKVSSANATATTPTPAPVVEEKVPPRRFVFFIDDMAMQENVRRNVIRQTGTVIDEMRDDDLGTVLRPTGPNRVAQNYTTDKAALRKAVTEAVNSCTIRLDAPGLAEQMQLSRSLAEASSEMERNHAKGVYAQQSRDRVQQRLAQLRALVGSLAGVEGRKVLMLVTAGIPSYPGRDAVDFEDQMKGGVVKTVTEWGQQGNFLSYIDDLARTAAANGVTVYAIEPEVPVAVGIQKAGASRTLGSLSRPGRGAVIDPRNPPTLHLSGQQVMPPQMLPELLTYRAQTLTSLTEKTGGKWFRGGGTVDDLFQQVATDMRTYYSLAYRAGGGGEKPRRIEVKIRNRPELRARTRSDVVERDIGREMADLTFANLLFPRDVHELKVRVEPRKAVAAGKAYNQPIDILIPLDKLTFAPVDGGKYAAVADIHFAAAGVMNNFMTSGRHRQNIEVSAEQHAKRAGVTTRFKTALMVPRGRTRIAVGVMDEASRQVGFTNVEVDAQ